MKRTKLLIAIAVFAFPGLCLAETWKDVSLVDVNCSAKVKDNPDAHKRNCALQCSKSGYGVFTADGTFLKLDANGNEEALTALKTAQRDDHLRVTVTGDRDGDTIKVKSLKM
jgi:hypothetical protein